MCAVELNEVDVEASSSGIERPLPEPAIGVERTPPGVEGPSVPPLVPNGVAEALPAGSVVLRTPKLPVPPSDELVAQHRLTRLPYAAWCH
eukprot:9456769-Heterocapsa_arctica.AAC.1